MLQNNTISDIYNYIASRGENLITNGTGLLGNNYNFSNFTYDGSQANNSAGSFKKTGPGTLRTDEFMPVIPTLKYNFSIDAKSELNTGRYYAFCDCYDVDKLSITASMHMYRANTLTSLTQDLNDGDTIVYLEDASNWDNSGTAGISTHLRSIILWNYVNSFGYLYPPETYSRRWYVNAWDPGAIDFENNTVTLRVPWSGGNVPAGTKLSNGSSGGTYKYFAMSSTILPTTWKNYKGKISGVDNTGTNRSYTFPPGTAYVKIGWLMNYQGVQPYDTAYFTNMSFAVDMDSPIFSDATFTSETGKAPISVNSATKVDNLNADLLDGQHGSYYLDMNNATNKPSPQVSVELTGDVTGSASGTLAQLGNGSISITASVADNSHNHTMSNIDGLDVALGNLQDNIDGKVDNSRVLTDVPAGAVFTDTVYIHPNHTGDVTSSGDGNTTISANAVTNTKFRQSGPLSIVGNPSNSYANVTDISAGTDGHVLRRSGTGLGFGTISTAGIANKAVTFSKVQDISTGTMLGRTSLLTGEVEQLTPEQIRGMLNISDGANNYSHPTQTAISEDNSGATVLQDIEVNSLGHVTSVATHTLTLANLGYTGATNANYYAHPSDGGGSIVTKLTGANVIDSITVNAEGHVTGTSTRALTLANLGYTGATNANNYVHPNHTGDVISSGDGSTTIEENVVDNTKLSDMLANRIKGAVVAGDPQDLTASQVRTMITDSSNQFATSAEKTKWNTHSDSAHAPADAPSNATFTGHTGDTTVHITSAERTSWNAKSTLELGETYDKAYRGDRGKTAYDHVGSDGSSHTFINQDVKTTASPTFAGVTATEMTADQMIANEGFITGQAMVKYNPTTKTLDFVFPQ
jgi:hypothetical protein